MNKEFRVDRRWSEDEVSVGSTEKEGEAVNEERESKSKIEEKEKEEEEEDFVVIRMEDFKENTNMK